MKKRFYSIIGSGFLSLCSAPVSAHSGDSGTGMVAGVLHMFKGEHLLTLALAVVFVAVAVRQYRIFRD
jgi:hypothetical protein